MKMLICHGTLADGSPCPAAGEPVMWDDGAQQLVLQEMRDEAAAKGETLNVELADPWCGACSTQYTDIRNAGDGQ